MTAAAFPLLCDALVRPDCRTSGRCLDDGLELHETESTNVKADTVTPSRNVVDVLRVFSCYSPTVT